MEASRADCQLVCSVLTGCNVYSEETRTMLAVALPHALGEGSQKVGDRHGFQTEMMDMVREALQSAAAHAAETQAGFGEKLTQLQADVESAKAHALETKGLEESAREDLSGKEARSEATAKEVTQLRKMHAVAKAAQTKAESVRDKHVQERNSAQAVQECTLSMLVSGGWEDKDALEDAVETVTKLLKESCAEDVLITGAPAAFAVKPESRGPFDKVIEAGIAEAVSKRLWELSSRVSTSESEVEDLRAEALGLWAMFDEAEEAAKEASKVRTETEASHLEAMQTHACAENDVLAKEKVVAAHIAEQEKHASRIVEIESAIKAFDRLLTGEYVVEPVAMEVDASAKLKTQTATNECTATAVLEAAPSMGA